MVFLIETPILVLPGVWSIHETPRRLSPSSHRDSVKLSVIRQPLSSCGNRIAQGLRIK